jgi:uncharacterized OsmC-like protein
LESEATGIVEKTEDSVLFIRSIHVKYLIEVEELNDAVRAKVERVMGFHARKCPVARTIGDCVEITTEVELTEGSYPPSLGPV